MTTPTENLAIVRRFFALITARQLDLIPEVVAADYINHNPSPGQVPGGASVQHTLAMLHATFDPMRFDCHEYIPAGDRVVARFTIRGIHRQPFLGVPATGKPIALDGVDIFRIAHGKIAEAWVVMDRYGFLQQTGALPA